jgi:hypothetical protein
MAKESSSHTGHAIRQLQNAFTFVAAGTTADTDITVTGVGVNDDVELMLVVDTGVPETAAGTVTVTAANTVQVSVDTSGKSLVFRVSPKSS